MEGYNLEGQEFCGRWLPIARAWCVKQPPDHKGNHAATIRTRAYRRAAQDRFRLLSPDSVLSTREAQNWLRRNSPRGRLVTEWKLERGCERCGYREDARALDLDHRDPLDKIATISAMVSCRRKYTDEQFVIELYKCRVLCANCHRIKSCEEGDTRKGRRRI